VFWCVMFLWLTSSVQNHTQSSKLAIFGKSQLSLAVKFVRFSFCVVLQSNTAARITIIFDELVQLVLWWNNHIGDNPFLSLCCLSELPDATEDAPVDLRKYYALADLQPASSHPFFLVQDIPLCCKTGKQQFYIYRVSIKSFPDYKYLLQENYME